MKDIREKGMNKYKPKDLRATHGEDYYSKIGKIGSDNSDRKKSAQTMKEKYGEHYFSVIGRMGAEKRRKNASVRKSNR